MGGWRKVLATAVVVACLGSGVPLAGAAPGEVSGSYHPTAPARLLDTRWGPGGVQAPVAAGASVTVAVAGAAGLPADGSVVAVALRVAVTEAWARAT